MADLTRTYQGFAPSGTVPLPTRRLAFERGVPVAVTEDEAAQLDADPDWSEPKPPSKPPTPKGSAPKNKES